MGKNKVISILAIVVLFVAVGSTLYVHAMKDEINQDNLILVNGNTYLLSELFDNIEKRTIEIDGDELSGIALDSLIEYSGVLCGSCHTYTIKATQPSPYQQTVKWENMQKGILTDYSRIYFPDIARAFWVYNVVEIEVK
ncbi:MAG: hypothetical protein R6V50_04965 [Thermoplasmatota archaeon]